MNKTAESTDGLTDLLFQLLLGDIQLESRHFQGSRRFMAHFNCHILHVVSCYS